jgi:two-component system sensor histidine kinase ChiS
MPNCSLSMVKPMDKASILLVETNQTDVEILDDVLTHSGFNILLAKNGEEALQQIACLRPNLILVDVNMPGLDGFEICRRVKAQETRNDIPLIFMSDSSNMVDKSKGFEVGAVDYVTKPFQREEVLARIHAYLTIQKLQRELQDLKRQMEEVCLTDHLTGMRNRRYLAKYIHNDIAEVHRNYHEAFSGKSGERPVNSDIVFLLMDLDHFKSVSARYGHQTSDDLLIQCREILENACRESDIVVRWGEDMFLVVSRYSNRDYAPTIADRIRAQFEDHAFEIERDRKIHLACSLGAASYPFLPTQPDYVNWEQVVAIANKGLSIAKKSGRNAYVNIACSESTVPDRLFQRIQEDIESVVQSGELQITSSLPASKPLVFR